MLINPEIIVKDKAWREKKFITKKLLSDITTNILNNYSHLKNLREIEFSVLLTNDQEIAKLNYNFRQKKQATNILSFPDIELNGKTIVEFEVTDTYLYLGDIALAYETINNEANIGPADFREHFIHLFIHALLHLLGYDHQEEKEALLMENLEIKFLSHYNIKSPY